MVKKPVDHHPKSTTSLYKTIYKLLKKNGKLLITVPAYKFLFTKKDIILGHYRRYRLSEIKSIFNDFRIKKLSYFNFFAGLPAHTSSSDVLLRTTAPIPIVFLFPITIFLNF